MTLVGCCFRTSQPELDGNMSAEPSRSPCRTVECPETGTSGSPVHALVQGPLPHGPHSVLAIKWHSYRDPTSLSTQILLFYLGVPTIPRKTFNPIRRWATTTNCPSDYPESWLQGRWETGISRLGTLVVSSHILSQAWICN
jgi:hypothetical protein